MIFFYISSILLVTIFYTILMPLTDTISDIVDTIIPTAVPSSIDGRQKLREAWFTEEVITNLWDDLIRRFEAALPIYQRWVEWNLALREALSLQHIEAWEATTQDLSTALENFIAQHPNSISSTIEAQTTAFTQRAESELTTQVQNQLEQHPIIGWIANIVNISASDIVNYWRERVSGNASWFSLIGILFGLFGFRNSTLFQDHISSINEFTSNLTSEDPSTTTVVPPVTWNDGDQTRVIEEGEERREWETWAATSWGYVIISYMSGVQRVENSDTLAVYERLWNLSYQNILEKIGEVELEWWNLKPWEIERVFWIPTTPENEETFFSIIQWVVWPYSTSFFNSMFVPQTNIWSIIFETWSTSQYSEIALEVFTREELDRIKETDYQELQLNELSRLSVLYCKWIYWRNIWHLQSAIWNISSSVRDFIFWEQVQQALDTLRFASEDNELYPESVALVFSNILSWRTYINSNTHNLTTGRAGFENLSGQDIERVDAIVRFRNQVTDIIPQEFSLWIPWFNQRFNNQLNYWKILSLYLMMGWRDLSQRTQMDNIVIYTWVYNLFEWSEQWLYESAMIESIWEESNHLSEDQRNMLTLILFRVVESNRNSYVEGVARVATLTHEVIKDQILWDVPISERLKDYLAYAVEVGWAYALWRILSLFPTTRAVLFVTWWVTIWAVLILSREVVYQQLSTEMQAQFDSFLEANLGWDSGLSAERLRGNIESWSISPTDLISRLNESIESGLSS